MGSKSGTPLKDTFFVPLVYRFMIKCLIAIGLVMWTWVTHGLQQAAGCFLLLCFVAGISICVQELKEMSPEARSASWRETPRMWLCFGALAVVGGILVLINIAILLKIIS
jgi:zinc transporter ZupT